MFYKAESEGIHHAKSSEKELIYTDEFKKVIHDHPGIIKSFRKINLVLEEKVAMEGESFEDGDLHMTVIDSVDWGENTSHRKGYYLKAECGENIFFVKTVPGHKQFPQESGGVEEFQSIQRAKELLRDEPDLEVVDFQLGYQDKDSSTSYFVSRWVDTVTIDDYLSSLQGQGLTSTQEADVKWEFLKRVNRLRNLLESEFCDLHGNRNIRYDPSSKKILIFDIHSKKHLLDGRAKREKYGISP